MAVAACESHSGKVWFFFSPQRIDAEKVGHLEIQVWSKYTWTIIEPIVRQIMFIGLLYIDPYYNIYIHNIYIYNIYRIYIYPI